MALRCEVLSPCIRKVVIKLAKVEKGYTGMLPRLEGFAARRGCFPVVEAAEG